jgi:hypothetical protein
MKWEYRIERINVGAVNRIEKIQEQLNTIGQEGWEVVATFDYDGNTIGLILKRQTPK